LRRYETIFITRPDLTDEDHSVLQEKLKSITNTLKGDLIKLEDWGLRKLGYEIRKNSRGHYFLLDYLSEPDLVRELERNLRLNDQVLKYQTVKISNQVSPDAARALKEASDIEKNKKGIEKPPTSEAVESITEKSETLDAQEGSKK
jgi:small subunit ribosomal protein S6